MQAISLGASTTQKPSASKKSTNAGKAVKCEEQGSPEKSRQQNTCFFFHQSDNQTDDSGYKSHN